MSATEYADSSEELELAALRRQAGGHMRNLTRGLGFLLLLFIVPLIAAGFWVEVQAEREIEQTELAWHLRRARGLAALVEREFVSAQACLKSIAGRRLFRAAWGERDLRGLERHLRELRELEPAFLFVSVHEPEGIRRLIDPPDSTVGLSFARFDWYRGVTAKWQPYVSEVYRRPVPPHPLVVALAVPISDDQGRPAGILTATYELEALQRKFESLEAGSAGALVIVDQHGRVAPTNGAFPAGELLRTPDAVALRQALAGKEGSSRFGSGDEEVFTGFAPVPALGWAVLYRRPAREALAPIFRLRWGSLTTGLYLLLVFLTTAGIAAMLLRREEQLLHDNRALNEALGKRLRELKSTEAALRSSEELMKAILDNTTSLVYILDRDERFLFANRQCEKVLERSASELLGKTLHELCPKEFAEVYRANNHKVLDSGSLVEFEEVATHSDGMHTYISVKFPLRDPAGAAYAVCGVSTDITERKRAAEALRLAKEEAERASRFKDQFLSTMSHELRTPLNAILGFSELLQEERHGALSDRQKRYVSHVHHGGEHLLRLINDILDLSKIEAGRLELALENLGVQEAFGEVLSTLRPLAEKKSQQLVHSAEPGLVVRADSTRFKQVLMNLLGNAIKFTPDGGHIVLDARKANGEARVEVRDSGPGIPREEQQRIFEAFCRLRNPGDGTEGTGLGLAITQRLIHLQGGQLGLESEPGRGSCFYFTLPAPAPAFPAAVPEVTPAHRQGRDREAVILVVENDPVAAQLIEHQVTPFGYETVLCFDPAQAAEMAAQVRPDAITLDILMKPINGWQVLNQLKGDPRTADIPVIMVSILQEPGLAGLLGADEYLTKPVNATSLLAAVGRCIAARGAAAEGRLILVVEDDAPTREMISSLLAGAGYSVAAVADGAEARGWVSQSLPEVVILDLLLPKVSGFELLAEWRASPRTADLPVFVLTGKDLSEAEEGYLQTYARSLFRKQEPWQEDLLHQLRRALKHSHVGKP